MSLQLWTIAVIFFSYFYFFISLSIFLISLLYIYGEKANAFYTRKNEETGESTLYHVIKQVIANLAPIWIADIFI